MSTRICTAGLFEVSVLKETTLNRNLIRDIGIPRECLIAAIIWDNKFAVPHGNTKIEANDRVIFIDLACRDGDGLKETDRDYC